MNEEFETAEYAGRALPQAVEAEIYLLGGLIQDPTSLDDIVGAKAGFIQDCHHICQGLPCLGFNSLGNLPCLRIDRELPRYEEGSVEFDCLGVWADSGRSVG